MSGRMWVIALIAFGVLAAATMWALNAYGRRHVAATMQHRQDDAVVFELDYLRVDSLHSIEVWDWAERELLWQCDINGLPKQVTYGLIPSGGSQRFPTEGSPRDLAGAETIVLIIGYRYDVPFVPASNYVALRGERPAAGGTVQFVDDETVFRILRDE